MAAAQAIVAAAMQPLTGHAAARRVAGAMPGTPAADASVAGAADWRSGYPARVRALVEGGLRSGTAALASARAGLDAAGQALRWVENGVDVPLAELAQRDWASPFVTHTLRGEGAPQPRPLVVPYRGRMLEGAAIAAQAQDWVRRGIVDPSAATALQRCVEHPEWFDLSDRKIVLLGAASEAGPLRWLAHWRANLVAIDLDRPAPWERIAGLVREGNATLRLPLRAGADDRLPWTQRAGADLLRAAPQLRAWLASFEGPLDIAAHAYAEGERHIRVVAAMDLVQTAIHGRPGSTLAFLATPTDVFAVPADTARIAMRRFAGRGAALRAVQAVARGASGGRSFASNVEALTRTDDGAEFGVVDCLVLQQGANYAVAKRIQQWRALVARAEGVPVSINVAPSTTTGSVVGNPALAAGFAGADLFGVEAFAPETTSALMAALWVHDLRSPASASAPERRLDHPYELLMDQACHGGMWTCVFRPRTALPYAAALGWWRMRGGRAGR